MIELIKRTFDIWCKRNWLRVIDKEVDRYNKLNVKLKRQHFVVNELIRRYNDLYGEDLRQK